MKRREFLKKGTVSGTIAAGPGLVAVGGGIREAKSAALSSQPVVGIAGSNDPWLASPVPLDQILTVEQVRELVWLALDRDTSSGSLPNIVKKNHWVVIKPNLVTCPVTMNDFHADGLEHWWLMTDLRVVKAVVEYIIDRAGPRRISIAEGPPWYSSGGKLKKDTFVDGWHCKWKGHGDLSYAEIVGEMNARRPETSVDIIDLNEDDPVYIEDFDPHKTGIGAYQDVKPGDPDGTSEKEWTKRKGMYYPKSVIDCDILVSVPVLKTHSSAGVTLCVKNLVGCIHSQVYGHGNGKTAIHQGSQLGLVRGIADLGASIRIDYSVAEGVWATVQQHHGQNGVGIHHNVVVAGGDVVATEAVSMMIMGYHPLDSDLLRMLHMKKIGEWNPDRITIAGPPVKALSRNFVRAANTFFARGIRKWASLGPVNKPLESIKGLNPKTGDRTGKDEWTLLDGDMIIDKGINATRPFKLQECLLFPLPESEGAKKGSHFYLAIRATTDRRDLCGQLLLGLVGGEVKVFFNGSEVAYPAPGFSYDPTPTPFLTFREGENVLVLEIRKTADRKEPVKFAANLCDLDGDRLVDITLDPDNEKLTPPVIKS